MKKDFFHSAHTFTKLLGICRRYIVRFVFILLLMYEISRWNVSAKSVFDSRTESRQWSLFDVTKFTVMAEVSAFGVVQTDTTAMVYAAWFLANVVTNKIAILKPLNTRSDTDPMVSSWTNGIPLSLHNNKRYMSFNTWFKFPRNVAAHALCSHRFVGG